VTSSPLEIENALLPVSDEESLARFIFQGNHIRADHTVKPNAFIPYPYPNLSVTRHIGLTEEELWETGRGIANERPATLYGRADFRAIAVVKQSLHIVPTETPRNHANITGWPPDKPSQKIIAQEIAAAARLVSPP
jgi:hypothetical protein